MKKLTVLLTLVMFLVGLPCVQAEETITVLDCAAQEGSLEYLKYVPTFEEAYAAAMEKVPDNVLIVDVDYLLQDDKGEFYWSFTVVYQDTETLQLQQLSTSIFGYDIGLEVRTSTSPFEQPADKKLSYLREIMDGTGGTMTIPCPTCRKKAISPSKRQRRRQTKPC